MGAGARSGRPAPVATVPLPPSLPPGRVVPVTSLHRQNDAKLRLPAHHARVGFIHLSRARLRNLPLVDFEIRPRPRYLRHPPLHHRPSPVSITNRRPPP